MRTLCEACGAAQAPDWQAGDLCAACGAAVRRELRCFWCAGWTPAGRFCRTCGAETVPEELYGAARMIKDAGTDRFTVPKMLRELEPDRIEDFLRIYQRQASVVARHVDDLRFAERFLHDRPFSAALEDELVSALPLPAAALERLTLPPLPAGDDLQVLEAIQERTPYAVTRAAAAIARLRLGDLRAHREATFAFEVGPGPLAAEAALALTSWRVRSALGVPRPLRDALVEELRRSPFGLQAAARLALLGHAADERLVRDALASSDRETSFTAALALGDVDRLKAALEGDDQEKAAAGARLIDLGVVEAVVEPIVKSAGEVQRELVEALLHQDDPVPEVADQLLEIVEQTGDDTLRERAARLLCRDLRPEWALRIARAARGERFILQSLLSERAALPPEAAASVAAFMIDEGLFAMHQYGLAEAGARGAIPDGFVPAHLARAPDEATRIELLRFAEVQLEARRGEDLHRFLLGVLFGPHPAPTRAAAWWALKRALRGDPRLHAFRLEPTAVERFFGSIGAFLPRLTDVLSDHATLKEVGVYDLLADLFGSVPASALPSFFAEEAAAHVLVRALLGASRTDVWPNLVDAMIELLGQLGTHPAWRDETVAGLEALDRRGNRAWENALRALRLSGHGLPDEPTWPDLPQGFVPERFAAAGPETRRLLLRVAEAQLIHREEVRPALARFLLTAVFGEGDPTSRAAALELLVARAPAEARRFALRPGPVAAAFGSLGAFLPRLTALLRDPVALEDPALADFLSGVLEDADTTGLAGEEGRAALVEALEAQRAGPLARAASSLLRALAPPAPPAPGPEPGPPSLNPWQEKHREVERLGRELQEAILAISYGADPSEEKSRRMLELQTAFQAKVKQIYGV